MLNGLLDAVGIFLVWLFLGWIAEKLNNKSKISNGKIDGKVINANKQKIEKKKKMKNSYQIQKGLVGIGFNF